MLIRVRAILVIFVTTLVIISFSVFVALVFVSSSIEKSSESDLLLMSDIADHYISSEIRVLKHKAEASSHLITLADDLQRYMVLESIVDRNPEFTSASLWSSEGLLIASTPGFAHNFISWANAIDSELARLEEYRDDANAEASGKVLFDLLQQASKNGTAISSPFQTNVGLVVCVAASINSDIDSDSILILEMPGSYFSQLLSSFAIWETGHIFLDDSLGHLVANPRLVWVEYKADFLDMSVIDSHNAQIVQSLRNGSDTKAQIIRYSIDGSPRISAYRSVSGSSEGWLLGVVAPQTESPFRYINNGLVAVGAVSMFLALIAAIIASGFIKKPFDEIAALKVQAEESSGAKSAFLANMSHEIRSPMNTILGVTTILLRDSTLPKSTMEALGMIHISGDMLLGIINDILDLSKIEAGKLEINSSDFETASLISDIAAFHNIVAENKGLSFSITVDETIPRVLVGDELRIKQILNNILSNAFKYTSAGSVNLSFFLATNYNNSPDGGKRSFAFSIKDTGQGMTKQQVDALFDQYTRFNNEANRTIEGTGLGMSITKNLIDLMNGEIAVESEPGKGSVFTVCLPLEGNIQKALGKDLAHNLEQFNLGYPGQFSETRLEYEPMPYGKVLIVDDMESNLYVAEGLMLPYELSIETATSGYEALVKIENGSQYDIVFMDHMMPGMDGIEATSIIREKLGYTLPIIALTANAVKGQEEVFLAHGFDDFLSKPIDIRQLNTILKKFVRNKHPQESHPAPAAPSRRENPHIPEQRSGAIEDIDDSRNSSRSKTDAAPNAVSERMAELFVKDAMGALEALESIKPQEGFSYDKDSLPTYTTYVHAMKSALGNIGESRLSSQAADLEKAGLQEDNEYLLIHTPAFIKALTDLVDKLQAADSSNSSSDSSSDSPIESSDLDYTHLTRQLGTVIEACAIFDRKTAKDAIVSLRETTWTTEINALLRNMSDCLLQGDFAKVSLDATNIIDILWQQHKQTQT